MPPCENLDSSTATQCDLELVCLKEASVAPVWMSWTAIRPGGNEDVLDVEHRMTSCSNMSKSNPGVGKGFKDTRDRLVAVRCAPELS